MKWTETNDLETSGGSTIVLYPEAAPSLLSADQGLTDISDRDLPGSDPAPIDTDTCLTVVTEEFGTAQSTFIDEGIQLVSLLARLDSLKRMMNLRQAQGPGATSCVSGHVETFDLNAEDRAPEAVAPEEGVSVLHQMHKADMLWREQSADGHAAASVPASERSGHIARLKTRTQALDRLTKGMRFRIRELQAEIGDLAAGLFGRNVAPTAGAGLRTLEVHARLDIAARLLTDGMSEALVSRLARLDADVVLALASDLD